MSKYIDRDMAEQALIKEAALILRKMPYITIADSLDRMIKIVQEVPAADVAPVVHGQWIRPHWKNSNYCCDCSECGGEAMHRDYQWDKNGIYPICPNCGAYMMGENNE